MRRKDSVRQLAVPTELTRRRREGKTRDKGGEPLENRDLPADKRGAVEPTLRVEQKSSSH